MARRTVVLPAVLGLLFGVTMTSCASSSVALKAKLLSVSDLPAGWSVTNQKSSNSSLTKCLSALKNNPNGGVEATVTFAKRRSLPQMTEQIATGPAERARVKAINHALSTCASIRLTIKNGKLSDLIGTVSFPAEGHQSWVAFPLTVKGTSANADLVLFRVGKDLADIFYVGAPTSNTVTGFVAEAVKKIEGKAV